MQDRLAKTDQLYQNCHNLSSMTPNELKFCGKIFHIARFKTNQRSLQLEFCTESYKYSKLAKNHRNSWENENLPYEQCFFTNESVSIGQFNVQMSIFPHKGMCKIQLEVGTTQFQFF